MLIKARFSELLFGSLLTIAVLGAGLTLSSSQRQPAETKSRDEAGDKDKTHPPNGSLWDWVAHDAASFFTLALFLVGGFQLALFWWQLRLMRGAIAPAQQAADAAKIAAEHIPTVERAFIHGGVHPNGRSVIRDEAGKPIGIKVKFSMANYGKTPGFITSVKIGRGKLSELGDDPIYSKDIPVSDLYFPMMTMNDLRYPDDVEITVPADGEHVVFQRVFYYDIFDKPHSSGSLHVMYIEGSEVRDRTVSDKPNYWKRD
jgi:hypothetical protein